MNFHDLAADAASAISRRHIVAGVASLAILTVGLFVAKRASLAVGRLSRLDLQQKLLFQRLIYYSLATLTVASALNQLGFDLKVLLGAAGVLTVAVGFAAQTSASNLISGFFLMADRPFVIGDTIQVGDITGEVAAMDLLSCRIRTFDNKLVRIPNETMVKSNIQNLSHFPIRRIDLNVVIGYESDIDDAREALFRAADRNPLVLDEPRPVFIFQSFAGDGAQVQLQAWALRQNLTEAQNALFEAAKDELQAAGLAFAPPARTVQVVAAATRGR